MRAPTAGGQPPLSNMRRALARAMTLSNATVPQFNVERAIDWTTLNKVRERFAVRFARACTDTFVTPTDAHKHRRESIVRWIADAFAGREWPNELARLAVALVPQTLVDGSLPPEQGRRVAAVR